jgi:hypothetical protein
LNPGAVEGVFYRCRPGRQFRRPADRPLGMIRVFAFRLSG